MYDEETGLISSGSEVQRLQRRRALAAARGDHRKVEWIDSKLESIAEDRASDQYAEPPNDLDRF